MSLRTIEPIKRYVAAVSAAGLIAGAVVVATYALSIVGAWIVIVIIAPDLHFNGGVAFTPRDFIATFAAGLVSFVLNNTLVVVAVSIAQGVPIFRALRSNLGFHTATTMVLIAQGPLIALAAARSIVWVLLFLPGIFGVDRTAMISVV